MYIEDILLWESLNELHNRFQGFWEVLGYFKAILNREQKKVGNVTKHQALKIELLLLSCFGQSPQDIKEVINL